MVGLIDNRSPKVYELMTAFKRTDISPISGHLLMDWALAEHQIPDSQFGFCPTRNTNQPLFILYFAAHSRYCKKKMKVVTAFLDLLAAYDSIPREKLWRHLQKINTPQYLRDIKQTMYTGCLYLLIDGDKTSEEVPPNKGLKQGCPLSPLLYSLYTNDIDRFYCNPN